MAKRPDFPRTHRYAERLQELLMPGAQELPAPLMSMSDVVSTYSYRLPDGQNVTMKIAIPERYLDEDDPKAVHTRTIESIIDEGKAITAIKEGVKSRARIFEEDEEHVRGASPPSIWIPEVYFNKDGILIREFMSGQIVSNAMDLTEPMVERYGQDIMTVSEGFGYAGWKAVKMKGDDPQNPRGLEIRTRLLVHHSPHINDVVLSPTGYDHLVNVRSPEFRQNQKEDFDHLGWLHAMARTAKSYAETLTR